MIISTVVGVTVIVAIADIRIIIKVDNINQWFLVLKVWSYMNLIKLVLHDMHSQPSIYVFLLFLYLHLLLVDYLLVIFQFVFISTVYEHGITLVWISCRLIHQHMLDVPRKTQFYRVVWHLIILSVVCNIITIW